MDRSRKKKRHRVRKSRRQRKVKKRSRRRHRMMSRDESILLSAGVLGGSSLIFWLTRKYFKSRRRKRGRHADTVVFKDPQLIAENEKLLRKIDAFLKRS